MAMVPGSAPAPGPAACPRRRPSPRRLNRAAVTSTTAASTLGDVNRFKISHTSRNSSIQEKDKDKDKHNTGLLGPVQNSGVARCSPLHMV